MLRGGCGGWTAKNRSHPSRIVILRRFYGIEAPTAIHGKSYMQWNSTFGKRTRIGPHSFSNGFLSSSSATDTILCGRSSGPGYWWVQVGQYTQGRIASEQ